MPSMSVVRRQWRPGVDAEDGRGAEAVADFQSLAASPSRSD
jgi:hypothetical protein